MKDALLVRLPVQDGQEEDVYSREAALLALRAFGVAGFIYGTAGQRGKVEWQTQSGTKTDTPAGYGQLTIAFPKTFPKGLGFVLVESDVPIIRDRTPDTLAQFGIRRLDGVNVELTVEYFAVGY